LGIRYCLLFKMCLWPFWVIGVVRGSACRGPGRPRRTLFRTCWALPMRGRRPWTRSRMRPRLHVVPEEPAAAMQLSFWAIRQQLFITFCKRKK
jgi:hypothetical protein